MSIRFRFPFPVAAPLSLLTLLFLTSACGGPNERTDDILALVGSVSQGMAHFETNCAGCHGADLTGGGGGPDISAAGDGREDSEFVNLILNGGFVMPAFEETLSDQEVADVMAYLRSEWE